MMSGSLHEPIFCAINESALYNFGTSETFELCGAAKSGLNILSRVNRIRDTDGSKTPTGRAANVRCPQDAPGHGGQTGGAT
jgi:hypothetical protein